MHIPIFAVNMFSSDKKHKISCFSGKIQLEDYVEIDAISFNGVQLGSNCRIGRYSSMRASNHYRLLGKGVSIGNNFSCGDFTFLGAQGG